MKFPVRDILSATGPVARLMRERGAEFESRSEQIELAQAVSLNMGSAGRLVAEAGTGVGKSFAYLVPAILRVLGTGERVVVCTHTIALQEQLIRRDLPFLLETLKDWGLPESEHEVRPVLVKGRGNYVSVRRLRQASARQSQLLPDAAQRRSLHVIEDWAYETRDGTLSSLPALERHDVWDRVQSDTDNCMGRKCPEFARCFYQRSRAEMELGNILVCNHALFFSDLAMRQQDAGFLPPYKHVVLDEAHTIEDSACDHFGLSVGEGRIEHLLGVLHHAHSGRGYLAQLSLGAGDTRVIDEAARAVSACQASSRAFFDEVLAAARTDKVRHGRVIGPGIASVPLPGALRDLAARLRSVREAIKNEPDKYELNAYANRAESLAIECEVLVGQTKPGCVYWVEGLGGGDEDFRAGGRKYRRLKLACSPIEVAPILRDWLFAQEISVTMTSATIAVTGRASDPVPADASERTIVSAEEHDRPEPPTAPKIAPRGEGSGFAHFKSRVGCEDARELLLGSPFDHAGQCRLIVDLCAVPPQRGSGGGAAEYHDALAARVLHHVRQTRGGAFVLFTSFAALHAVADRIGGELDGAGMPVLVQGRDGSPGALLEKFRLNEDSVLLGAASFWQGVDVKGRGLRNVVITRLPFDPPDRPIVEARGERIRSRGGDPFGDDALPRAILRFKQGFGRLIRSKTDRGQVVVLDPRLMQTNYGRKFIEALPGGLRVERIHPGRAGLSEARP